MKMRTVMLGLVLGLAMAAAGCKTTAGGLTPKDQIAIACDSAASALEVITAAKVAGKISKAELDSAIAAYRPTVAFCQPVAENLNAVDFGALLRAAATLSAKSAAVKP